VPSAEPSSWGTRLGHQRWMTPHWLIMCADPSETESWIRMGFWLNSNAVKRNLCSGESVGGNCPDDLVSDLPQAFAKSVILGLEKSCWV